MTGYSVDPQKLLAEEMGSTAVDSDREEMLSGGDFADVKGREDDILRWNPELYAMEFVSDNAMHWCARNEPGWREEVVE